MFSPISYNSTPTTINLVATALPNTLALRVPSTNVAPSVSSAQIDNNASAKTTFVSEKKSLNSLAVAIKKPDDFEVQNSLVNQAKAGIGQAAFFAQLANSDSSPEVNKFFAQYEKLVKYQSVKYKPSDAGKPIE